MTEGIEDRMKDIMLDTIEDKLVYYIKSGEIEKVKQTITELKKNKSKVWKSRRYDCLYEAAVHGHEEIAKLVLSNEKIFTKTCPQRTLLLMSIIVRNNYNMLKLVLSHCKDLVQERFNSLVIAATIYSSPDIVELLLSRYMELAKIAATTALPFAVKYNRVPTLKVLLENSANPNVVTHESTPLLEAVSKDSMEMVEILIKHGADPNTRHHEFFHSCLHRAVTIGNRDLVEFFMFKQVSLDARERENNCTALLLAIIPGKEDIALQLIKYGADVNTQTKTGQTPLHMAAKYDLAEVVAELLDNRAFINAKNDYGCTPLYLACINNNMRSVTTLIAYNANVNIHCHSLLTPLHLVAQHGYDTMLKLLLENKAKINTKNKDGQTPLLLACAEGKTSTAKLLLEKGADIHIVDKNKRNALFVSCRTGNIELVKHFLSKNAKVNIRDKSCLTPLLCVLSDIEDNYLLINLLLENGANPNAKDTKGNTVLHYAVRLCSVRVISRLLHFHADFNFVDRTGKTAFNVLNAEKDNIKDFKSKQDCFKKFLRKCKSIGLYINQKNLDEL